MAEISRARMVVEEWMGEKPDNRQVLWLVIGQEYVALDCEDGAEWHGRDIVELAKKLKNGIGVHDG